MEVVNKFMKEFDKILAESEPDLISWWKQQPENFLEHAFNSFEEFITKNPNDSLGCELVMAAALSDIKLYARFHRFAKEWVEKEIKNGRENNLSWRLKSPKEKESHNLNQEKNNMVAILSKTKQIPIYAESDQIK